MIIRKSLTSLAAAGLILGSTAAAAAPVADRSGSDVPASENVAGVGTYTLLLGLLVIGGVIAIVASSDNNNTPTSP
jgi:hypothetical protein